MTADLEERLRRAVTAGGAASSDFDLNPDVVLAPGRRLRPAGVLIAVRQAPAGAEVILTMRSSALKHHPGQIAFPGGKQDAGDADVVAAALREAHEEVGLPTGLARVIGTLPEHETVTGFRVTPVLALVEGDFAMVPEPGEVDEVFCVPLSVLADPQNYMIQSRHWRGSERHYFVVPYGPYYIWGATARMLRALAGRMAP